ncbi:hypothetical protein T07_7935 [Trichinella nelsoni]|uniref:Uncharacterized protein n=1 Tax=Trichinella nelsoni TaxID=6336 RepID=A0A0V0RDE4_9BILA|nr:hypothetical protein T07_7935 [Trichinella nelsoni]
MVTFKKEGFRLIHIYSPFFNSKNCRGETDTIIYIT